MTVTKVTSKLNDEEKAVLKRIYEVRMQILKEMEGMTIDQKVAYINNMEKETHPRNAGHRSSPMLAKR
jgi:hypothetical protein